MLLWTLRKKTLSKHKRKYAGYQIGSVRKEYMEEIEGRIEGRREGKGGQVTIKQCSIGYPKVMFDLGSKSTCLQKCIA